MKTVKPIDAQQNNPACYFNLWWKLFSGCQSKKKMHYMSINPVQHKPISAEIRSSAEEESEICPADGFIGACWSPV